jgi:CelD/BcsL family acetyltransferase involved in cellulose biosynthesis
MRVSVVRPDELSQDDIASWHAMQSATPSLANPFLSAEFAIAVGQFRPSTRVAILSEGAGTVGFLPFDRGRFGTGAPVAPGLTDSQGLVHAPGLQWDARELLRACRLDMWRFDHLAAEQYPFERYRQGVRPSPVIDLAGGFDVYYEKLRARSPQFCKTVERKARKLEREAGPLRFVADCDDLAVFRRVMAWKSLQYQRTGQVDLFTRPWIAGLVEVLFGSRGSRLSGLLSVLYASDVPVAAHFGLRGGDVLAHWCPAYDTAYGKYSAGLIMHLRLAELTASAGVRTIDMGTGVQRYKEELKSGDLFVGFGAVSAGSVRGAALAAAHGLREGSGRRLAGAVKHNAALSKAAYWLRGRRYPAPRSP